jgi:DNA-binding beta-propeller fold protein YncE
MQCRVSIRPDSFRVAILPALLLVLASWGGGGGGGGGANPPGPGGGGNPPPPPPAPTPAPTITLTGSASTAEAGSSVLLTWASTNATSCSASGGWTGAKQSAGDEMVGVLEAQRQFTLSCTGPGGTASSTVSITVEGLDPLPEPTAPGYQSVLGRWFELGAGEGVKDIAVDEMRRKVYVSVNHHVAVLSADTYLLERIVPVGAWAYGISLSADGSSLYVALFQGGAIAVVDTTTFAVRRIEVALLTGSPNIFDVEEARPGVVLVSAFGLPNTTRTAFVVAVDVDDPTSAKQIGDKRDGRGGPVFHLTPDRKRAFYRYFDAAAGLQRTVAVDTAAADLPVVFQGPTGFALPDQLEFNQRGDLMMGPGGSVLEASTLSSLRRSVMSGVVARSADGSEIGALDGSMFYLFDGDTLRLEARYRVDGCHDTLSNVLRASGRRGEWIVGKAGSDMCVFSTTLDPMSKPGADGSRSFPVPPAEQHLPIIENVIAGLSTEMVIDPPRKRIYVATTSPVGLGSIDSDTGVPVDFLPLPATPISLEMSADGTRLMAGLEGNGRVLVIDVPGWQVAAQLDLSSLLIQPNVTGFTEIGPNAWITTAANPNPTPGMQYPLVLFDPDDLSTARRVGNPQGYCGYVPAVSPDRRYAYAPHADCTLVLEKRDMSSPGWDLVTTSDGINWLSSQGMLEVSLDGERLYTDQGLVYSTTTLRQVGRFLGEGRYKEVPNTSLLTVHGIDTLAVYDRDTLLPVSLGSGYCEAWRESEFAFSPRLFPDFSRGAVLAGGTIAWPRALCIVDFRGVVP